MIQTIADALATQGYDSLTPVQEAVTNPDLVEADLLVSAQTGSGKTVAFGLAIAPTLLGDDEKFGHAGAPLALIIAPTRELAMQVSRELTWLYGKAGAVVTTCVGGMDTRTERRALDRGAHIVVATPGRLCDHIKRNNINLSDIRAVVLDEADEMLDLGFREELEFILSEAPEERRTLLFSATVPAAIAKLAKSYQRDAQRVETVGEKKQHADIEYRALNVHPRDTENAIINVLRFYEAKNAIVFCNTRAAVARLTTRFTNRGFSVVALSGELTQSERTNALQALRDGRARVCIATDVAARGIDLPNLELVVHADLPSNSDTLLHRSGRTGRAGRKGVSALIVPAKMRSKANRLIGGAKLKVEWANPPSAEEVNAEDEKRLLADSAWSNPIPDDAAGFVANLVDQFSPEQLATAFVNLYRARQSAPEQLAEPDRDREPDRRTKVATGAFVGRGAGLCQLLGRGLACTVQVHKGRRQLLGAELFDQIGNKARCIIGDRVRPCGIGQQALFVFGVHFFSRGRVGPFDLQLGAAQQTVCLAAHLGGNDQRGHTLSTGTTGTARAVQQRVRVRRQIGMHHQFEVGQVDPACGNICCNTDARAPVAQRLQRVGAFGLRQLARQRHD